MKHVKNDGVYVQRRWLLLILCTVLTHQSYADMVQLDTTQSGDSLNRLVHALATSDKTVQKEEPVPAQKVFPEDYQRLSIQPLYKDSEVSYHSNDRSYKEIKYFSNNIMMLHNLNDKYVFVVDLENEDPVQNGWAIACEKDHITDEKNCVISKFDLMIVTKELSKLNYYKYHYIRIDKNQPFKTKDMFWGQSALNIIQQMQRGSVAYTRFYDWSDSYEETLSLYGLSAAYQIMNIMYARL